MKTLYLDCSMGCAGDMLTAALVELFPDPVGILAELNGLGIPNVKFIRHKSIKCGITGTHMRVFINDEEECCDCGHHHHHGSMADIAHIVNQLQVPDKVKQQVLEMEFLTNLKVYY